MIRLLDSDNEMVCSRAMRSGRKVPGRLGAAWACILILAASAPTFGVQLPNGPGAPPMRGFAYVQYGGNALVCDELHQRRIVSQYQMNERLRNFLLFDAAERGCIRMVRDLLSEGASVSARDRFGNTALLRAAHGGEDEVVRLLIEKKSDVLHQNLAGSTALMRAVNMNRRRTVNILLEAGADPNQPNRRNVSPLIAAAYNGNVRVTEILLKAGARSDQRDATGKSAMVYAAAKGYAEIVAMLLDAGVRVDERYENDLTALMWAAGHTDDVPIAEGLATLELLRNRGASIELTEARGRTALMIAAERGHAEIVAALIDAGADDKRRDVAGKTAADLAANDAVRLLLPAN